MIAEGIHKLLKHDDTALKDKSAFFWVEWNEDDDQIPALCAVVLQTDELSCDWDESGAHPDLYIVWRGARIKVPLIRTALNTAAESTVVSVADSIVSWMLPIGIYDALSWPTRGNRHITLWTLNQTLLPDYEIRYVRASADEDTAGFAALSFDDWAALEGEYGSDAVNAAFAPISLSENLFQKP